MLFGNDFLGYARKIPEDVLLPFYEETNLPPIKFKVPLVLVSNVVVQGEKLVIVFDEETKLMSWEFVCEGKECAEEWKEIIDSAVRVSEMARANQLISVTIPEQTTTT